VEVRWRYGELCLHFLRGLGRLAFLLGLLGEERGVDVGQDTSGSDRDVSQQLVQLLVVSDGELDVARDDSMLFVVARGVSGELEDFGREIFEDSCQIDGGSGTDSRGVASVSNVAMDPADWELESCSE